MRPGIRSVMSKQSSFYLCELASLLAGPAYFAQESLFTLSPHAVVGAPNTGPNKRRCQHDVRGEYHFHHNHWQGNACVPHLQSVYLYPTSNGLEMASKIFFEIKFGYCASNEPRPCSLWQFNLLSTFILGKGNFGLIVFHNNPIS